jgi:hypothetical protein
MRDKHCSQAVLNSHGRCIAICHHLQAPEFEQDCTGVTRDREKELEVTGREYQIEGHR